MHCFPYPVETGHLQLPQDVVLRRALVHVPHQNLPKLLSAVEVGPVTDTFVLNQEGIGGRKMEREGCIRQSKEAAHLKQLNCHTILVSRLPPHPHTLPTIIPTTLQIMPSNSVF